MAGFALPIISGLAGLFGGASTKQTNTQSSGNQTSSGTSGGSTTPNLSPLQQQLATLFTNNSQNMANNDPNLTGYTASGLQTINQSGNAATTALNNSLASRGLSFSPAAANAATQNTNNQINQGQQFLNQIPLLQRQLAQQNTAGLESAFGALPTGVTTTGSFNGNTSSQTNQSQTQQTPGGLLAGLFGGAGAGLAALPNLFNSGGNSNPPVNGPGNSGNSYDPNEWDPYGGTT